MTEAKDIHFDGWVLRPSSVELLRDGNTQRLAQQPLRMLVELLEHSGGVVTRERLMQVLWPKGIVDFDNSPNAVVRKLRVAHGVWHGPSRQSFHRSACANPRETTSPR